MPISRTYLTMKEMRNISLWILVLLATSWCWVSDQKTIDLRGFGAIVAPIACLVLARWIWESLRDLLDRGMKIPRDETLAGHFSAFAIFIPTIMGFTVYSHQPVETAFHIGGGPSVITGIFGGAAIILYETLRRIKFVTVNTRNALSDASISGAPFEGDSSL